MKLCRKIIFSADWENDVAWERYIFRPRLLFKIESASNFLSNDILHDYIWKKKFHTSPTRIPKRLPYWIFHFPGPVLVTWGSTQIFVIYLGLTKVIIPVWWVEKNFLRDCVAEPGLCGMWKISNRFKISFFPMKNIFYQIHW